MANDLNLCQFIGRLGKDPETRYLPNGDAAVSVSLAVGWKTKDKEGTEWVRVSAFGRLAEIIAEYLKKGSQVYVAGRFTTRKWEDKNGETRYSTEIVADRMQMLGSKQDGEAAPRQASAADYQRAKDGAAKKVENWAEGIDDDIPF